MIVRRACVVTVAIVLTMLTACAAIDVRRLAPTSVVPPPTATAVSIGDSEAQVTTSGTVRQYRIHVPASYRPDQAVPLVLNFSGFGETALEQELLSGMSRQSDLSGFIVVYPEARGQPPAWFVGPGPKGDEDVAFVGDLIRQVESEYHIDANRIYATGISNGGGMVNQLGCRLADTFAAIAPVSGAYVFWNICRPSRPVAVVAFHGTADRIVPYDGEGRVLPPIRDWAAAWAARDSCDEVPRESFRNGSAVAETWDNCQGGAAVTLYTIQGFGHMWPGVARASGFDAGTSDVNATQVIWQFFAAHPRIR